MEGEENRDRFCDSIGKITDIEDSFDHEQRRVREQRWVRFRSRPTRTEELGKLLENFSADFAIALALGPSAEMLERHYGRASGDNNNLNTHFERARGRGIDMYEGHFDGMEMAENGSEENQDRFNNSFDDSQSMIAPEDNNNLNTCLAELRLNDSLETIPSYQESLLNTFRAQVGKDCEQELREEEARFNQVSLQVSQELARITKICTRSHQNICPIPPKDLPDPTKRFTRSHSRVNQKI